MPEALLVRNPLAPDADRHFRETELWKCDAQVCNPDRIRDRRAVRQ
jgi:hypothetical protein